MAYSILVVDDEALTLRTIGRALQAEGYDVTVAMSAEEGLKKFAEEKPDLALLDVVLPGMDGIDLLRQIKKQHPQTIVLMMSAYHIVYLINTIGRASEMLTLRGRVRETVLTQKGRYDFGKVITQSRPMREMLE